MVSFFSGEDTPSTDTSHLISLLPEVCRSVIFGPPCINSWDNCISPRAHSSQSNSPTPNSKTWPSQWCTTEYQTHLRVSFNLWVNSVGAHSTHKHRNTTILIAEIIVSISPRAHSSQSNYPTPNSKTWPSQWCTTEYQTHIRVSFNLWVNSVGAHSTYKHRNTTMLKSWDNCINLRAHSLHSNSPTPNSKTWPSQWCTTQYQTHLRVSFNLWVNSVGAHSTYKHRNTTTLKSWDNCINPRAHSLHSNSPTPNSKTWPSQWCTTQYQTHLRVSFHLWVNSVGAHSTYKHRNTTILKADGVQRIVCVTACNKGKYWMWLILKPLDHVVHVSFPRQVICPLTQETYVWRRWRPNMLICVSLENECNMDMLQWQIQAWAQQALLLPQFWSTISFCILSCVRMLQAKAPITWESI